MTNKAWFGTLTFSILLAGVTLLFSGWAVADQTVKTRAHYGESPELSAVRNDLSKIDSYASEGVYTSAAVIVGRDISAREVYRAYLAKAAGISESLLKIRKNLDLNNQTLSLQELGALTQRVSAENLQFRNQFSHGEERFQTFRLIEKAVVNLEDAISYWRLANHYRALYRGSARERFEDDEVLKVKLQTALNAIDELQAITATRDALSKDLEED